MVGYTPKNFIELLKEYGWKFSHRKSNHVSFAKTGVNKIITIPEDRKELSRPLAKRLLKDAGIM